MGYSESPDHPGAHSHACNSPGASYANNSEDCAIRALFWPSGSVVSAAGSWPSISAISIALALESPDVLVSGGTVLLFLRLQIAKAATSVRAMTPNATPTPIPALAPAESAELLVCKGVAEAVAGELVDAGVVSDEEVAEEALGVPERGEAVTKALLLPTEFKAPAVAAEVVDRALPLQVVIPLSAP
jgi:hypothetical protein